MEQAQTEAQARDMLAACHQTGYAFGAGIPAVILPEGYELKTLEHTLAAPARKKGVTTLNDAESFIAVVNDQKIEGSTRLFSTIDPPTFTAVFNHTGTEPGWGDHRARYNAPLSPEWKAWNGMDGTQKSQVELAQFIENNLVDVVSPDGATLLEICRTLEAKKKVNFASAIRLSDGSHQFTYEEDVQGTAQKGQLKVPEEFVIGIPVFENGAKWQINVRLRYRIQDGGRLTMWIELIRPHKTIEAAVAELRKQIADETSLQILNGTPSA